MRPQRCREALVTFCYSTFNPQLTLLHSPSDVGIKCGLLLMSKGQLNRRCPSEMRLQRSMTTCLLPRMTTSEFHRLPTKMMLWRMLGKLVISQCWCAA